VSLYPPPAPRPTFAATLRSFAHGDALPLPDIEDLCDQEGVHFGQGDDDVWTPAVTLWAFLAQCLSGSKSCVAAVARVLVLRVALGLPPCSAATGAYCKARAKLPEDLLRRLTLLVGNAVEDQAPDGWRLQSRRVLLADGAECSMPDTEANQQEYPQPGSQKPGLGFPLIRLVVLLTFATAALVGCAVGPHQGKGTGETALFRELLGQVRAGDVVVADRYYCSYWLLALLLERGADVCLRLHQRRRYDFRRGRRLGRGDHVVTWARPARPDWMDEDTYARMPETLTVREVCFVVTQPGCRSREVLVATTLTDARAYPKADIAELYHHRWQVELDIRSIKQALKMDVLSCKTPARVRKEVWAHLLAYNLVRQAMTRAARAGNTTPRRLSFAGAVQTLNAFRWALLLGPEDRWAELVRAVLLAIGTHRVGDRPGRCEPRKVKRRPKGYPRLTRPRAEERAEQLRGQPA
jgi:Transposase DDE domain